MPRSDLTGTPSAREEVLELIEEPVDLELLNVHLDPRSIDDTQDFTS